MQRRLFRKRQENWRFAAKLQTQKRQVSDLFAQQQQQAAQVQYAKAAGSNAGHE